MVAKRFFYICAGLLTFAVPLHAAALHDDFDGNSIDLSKWNLAGGGTVTVSGGHATLSAGCGEQFPYLTPRSNPFPVTGDFLVRVGFRYSFVGGSGNGFGFDFFQPILCVWQDAAFGLRACVGDGPEYLISPTQDLTYHVFQYEYVGGVYHFSVDGVEVAQDACSLRPNQFYFGHPPFNACDWTMQEIDFVHIEALDPTPAASRTWGSVKLIYR
jgi:hypothetical protein